MTNFTAEQVVTIKGYTPSHRYLWKVQEVTPAQNGCEEMLVVRWIRADGAVETIESKYPSRLMLPYEGETSIERYCK